MKKFKVLAFNKVLDKVKDLFKKRYDPQSYHLELVCDKCGEHFYRDVSKGKLLEFISYYKKAKGKKSINAPLCNKCLENKKEEDEKERKKMADEHHKRRIKDTDTYIENYLNPNNKWNEGVKTYVKMQKLNVWVDDDKISSHINEMEYSDFLETPYWKAISEKVRYKSNFKCQLCGSTNRLNVHHRDYSHHGNELNNMGDLICLCQECHSKFHDK